MTSTVEDEAAAAARPPATPPPATAAVPGPLALAGIASIGAGAIHATAAGAHSEHQQVVWIFTILAIAQIGWGAWALASRRRTAAWAGALLGLAAVGGWMLAKTTGIPFVDGLQDAEAMQFADTTAAVLAAIAAVVSMTSLIASYTEGAPASAPRRSTAAVMSALVLVAGSAGMVTTGNHSHATGEHEHAAGVDDAHEHDEATAHEHPDGTSGTTETDDEVEAEASVVPPQKYDPTMPIDLSGIDGVTPQQQAAAENLIAVSLARLPRYADYRAAEADGFLSIGDGGTGHEHFINWSYINDEHILDPDFPESLVYRTDWDGSRELVSAMYMLTEGASLDEVPELGGKLTQWHIHDDLCFSDDPVQPRVAGITSVGGECSPPLRKFTPTPMIHVWIVPHPCGPFAALEGVAGGQVKEGETHFCDHVHGSGH